MYKTLINKAMETNNILPPGYFNACFMNGKLMTDLGILSNELLTIDTHGNYRLTHMLQFHAAPLQDGQLVQLPNAMEIYQSSN